MKPASSQNLVDSTLSTIMNRLPAYADLGHRFGPLIRKKAELRDTLSREGVAVPVMDTARLAAGVPLLVEADMRPWNNMLNQAKDALLPLVADVLELDEKTRNDIHDYLDYSETISGLAQARIEGNWNVFENTSIQLGLTPPTTLLYISETIITPVLCIIADSLGESLSSLTWEQGFCPVCGSAPSISWLSPKEVTDLDQLVGGGGKKFLHCSLCGHDWRFKRNVCAACGNDENESREVFTADDITHERIEACHKCGKYCLNIDMRECEPQPDLDVLQMGLIHLDVVAQEKNLQPLMPTLWNTFA